MFKLNNEKQIVPNQSLTGFNGSAAKYTGRKTRFGLNETNHFHPATKEWVNSVYFFNKDFLKTIPHADNAVNRLIKSYFSISPILNKKKSRRVELRFKRLSLNRILVSKAEMKHTNNKVVVTVYLYNKEKKTLLYRLKNLYNTLYFSNKKPSTPTITSRLASFLEKSSSLWNSNKIIGKKLSALRLNPENSTMSNNQKTSKVNSDIVKKINTKKSRAKKDEKIFMRNNKLLGGLTRSDRSEFSRYALDKKTASEKKKFFFQKSPKHNVRNLASNDNVKQDSALRLKLISAKSVNIINKVRKYKSFLLRILRWNNNTFANYETKYYKKFLKKVYRKEFLYLYYTRMLSLNNIKFENWFILGLKKVLSNIYKKRIEFNFVNLKYLHLNSDIFSESIAVKLRNRENRLLTVLRKALTLVKLFKINNRVFYGTNYHTINHNDKVTKDLTNLNVKSDILNTLLQSLFTNSNSNNKDSTSNSFIESKDKKALNSTQISALDSIKHKAVFGVRLEAAGRLSKRLTASRSLFKLRYKGSLKNIDSSYHGLSSTILRGNTKSNLQYTKVSSKTRNGAFGLKGWVSGY